MLIRERAVMRLGLLLILFDVCKSFLRLSRSTTWLNRWRSHLVSSRATITVSNAWLGAWSIDLQTCCHSVFLLLGIVYHRDNFIPYLSKVAYRLALWYCWSLGDNGVYRATHKLLWVLESHTVASLTAQVLEYYQFSWLFGSMTYQSLQL